MADAHNIKDEVKKYYKVFAALMVLTVVTVWIAGFEVGVTVAVTLALIVATMKASLVASFFMHLIAEKKAIYVLLGFTVFFFIAMIFLSIVAKYDMPQKAEYLVGKPVEDSHGAHHDGHHHKDEKHSSDKEAHH